MRKKEKWTNKENDKYDDAESLLHNTTTVVIPMFVGNFKSQGSVVPEKSLTKMFIGEKEKWTNKGNDRHEDAGSILHSTSSHAQCLYQISKLKCSSS